MPSQKSAVTHVTMMLCLVMAVVTTSHVEASDTWSPTGSMSTRARATPQRCCQMAECSSAAVPATATVRGQRGDLRSGARHLVANGSMSTARYGHTATLLPDGRVLVSGGSDGSSLLGQRGNLRSGAGHLVADGLDEHEPLLPHGHVAARWPGARQRRLRGCTSLASAEIYDPALGTWSPTASMSTARFDHTATLLQDGRVLVSGGQYQRSNIEHLGQRRDLRSGAGHLVADGLDDCGRANAHTATLLLDGRVLVSGGFSHLLSSPTTAPAFYEDCSVWESAEIYDPVSGTWWETGSMRAGTRYLPHEHAAIRRPGARQRRLRATILGPYLASAEIYNPAHGTWSLTAG